MVGVAQHFFPEPAPGGQQRVISDKGFVIIGGGREAGVLELAGQFALIRVHAFLDVVLLLGFFSQDCFTNYTFNIAVGELD